MNDQQINTTHGLLSLLLFSLPFLFLHNYNHKKTTTDYPQHDLLYHKQFLNQSPPYMCNNYD